MITRYSTLDEDFAFVDQIVVLMDSKYQIPGTNFRFGLDPIFNMIPFLGQMISFSIAGILVVIMAKNSASGKVVAKMVINIVIDLIIGIIPVFGTVGDFFYKANQKNLRLLKGHYYQGKHNGSAWGIVITLCLLLFTLFTIVFITLYKLIFWVVDLLRLPDIFAYF